MDIVTWYVQAGPGRGRSGDGAAPQTLVAIIAAAKEDGGGTPVSILIGHHDRKMDQMKKTNTCQEEISPTVSGAFGVEKTTATTHQGTEGRQPHDLNILPPHASAKSLRPSSECKTLIGGFASPIHEKLDALSSREDMLYVLSHDVLDRP